MLNALSIDVEDYFQVTAFESLLSRRDWDAQPSRVVANTRRLLELLDRRGASATFFVLGWVARRFPELVREIRGAGHEVGCHGFWHARVYEQSPDEFRADVRLARDVLTDITGTAVMAYRAPSFSITRRSLWALEILADEGFRYDSSIFPVYHDRYGIPDANRLPHRIATRGGELLEFPATVARLWNVNLPIAGGGYFRLMPLSWIARALGQVNRLGQPFVFYLHPWELDPDQPHVAGAGWTKWRHYVNLATTETKLDWLLRNFRFDRLDRVLDGLFGRSAACIPA
jgi:polysaccharide deacetylase family protein (PEP-CTERM system associated)